MNIIEAIFCGIVQGACEFLPISSSGHLALLHGVFGYNMGGDLYFDVLLHLGTLVAVVLVYFKDILAIGAAYLRIIKKIFCLKFDIKSLDGDEKTAVLLAFASLPMALALFIKDRAEVVAAYPRAVGVILIFNGAMLLLGSFMKRGERSVSSLSPVGALEIGLFQLLAVLPGISRSGSTITGGGVFGLSREESVRFSFLMSIPAIVGANVFAACDMALVKADIDILPCAVGATVAMVVGIASIWLIKKLIRAGNFNIFGVYCIGIGAFFAIYGV